jgi:aminoglycoside phosphotransferase (APT) family kinase protein
VNAATSSLPAELSRWIEDTTGGALIRATRLPGGNRREAWAIDVARDGVAEQLFLRYDPVDPTLTGDVFTIPREAAFYEALKGSGVAIPAIRALHPTLQAMLTARVSGASDYVRIADVEDKRAIARDFMRHLARLHALDAGRFTQRFPAADRPIPKLIADEIAIWNDLYRQTGRTDPLIAFGLDWLTRNIPNVDAPPRIVHGDAGPGNFLFEDGRVTALLDWELAHFGDPIEDLAWLSMRTTLEPFPDFVEALREYERASGAGIDRDRLRYLRVLVQWRIVIIRHRNAGEDPANSLISRAINRRLLVEAIAGAERIALPRYAPLSAPAGANEALYDTTLGWLRDTIAPAINDPFARAKAKSAARIVKYLKLADRLGPAIVKAEVDDLAALLGHTPATLDEGRDALATRIADGDADAAVLLPYFARHVGRDTQLMEDALGALAWRPFPPIGEES